MHTKLSHTELSFQNDPLITLLLNNTEDNNDNLGFTKISKQFEGEGFLEFNRLERSCFGGLSTLVSKKAQNVRLTFSQKVLNPDLVNIQELGYSKLFIVNFDNSEILTENKGNPVSLLLK